MSHVRAQQEILWRIHYQLVVCWYISNMQTDAKLQQKEYK